MFISEVFAADSINNASSVVVSLANVIPYILICAVFYFLLLKPHSKRLKEHREMVSLIKCGDVVVTSGGIIGEVNKVDETSFIIEIAPKVEVKVTKSAISEVLNKDANQPQKVTTKPAEKVKIEKNNKKNKDKSVNDKKDNNDKNT